MAIAALVLGVAALVAAFAAPGSIEVLKRPRLEIVPTPWAPVGPVSWTFATVQVRNKPITAPLASVSGQRLATPSQVGSDLPAQRHQRVYVLDRRLTGFAWRAAPAGRGHVSSRYAGGRSRDRHGGGPGGRGLVRDVADTTQQMRQRGTEAERQHRQAGHQHHHRPRRTGRVSGGQQVIDDLPGHTQPQRAQRRPAGERRAAVPAPGVSQAPSAYAP